MIVIRLKNYILLAFILFFATPSSIQGQQKNFTQLSVNEGLSHSDATSIVQDNYSYLWIATNSGLNKYDGYSFETFKWESNDSLSIPGNRILKLLPTKDKIWLLIENKGLYYYSLLNLSFNLVKKIPKLSPSNFMFEIDQNDGLWLFQDTLGLIKITMSNSNLTDKLTLKEQIVEEKIFPTNDKVTDPLFKQMVEINNNLYFFGLKGEIYQYSLAAKKFELFDMFKSGSFQTAMVLSSSKTLISFKEGLYLWDSSTKKKQEISVKQDSYGLSIRNLNCIYIIDDVFYFGTENGLYSARLIKKDGLNLVIDKEIIPNIKVNSIFKDKFNILWVASSGYGLFYKNLEKLPFGHIYFSDSENKEFSDFAKNYTSSILKERGTNLLWIGTKDGLYKYNLTSKKYTNNIKELINKHIRFLFQDSSGEIWIGTYNDGVYRYNREKLIKHYKYDLNNKSSITSKHIISISEDHLGRIWLASFNNGLSIYDKNTDSFQFLFNEPFNKQSLGSNNLTYLYFHKKQQRMYVSTRDAGITVINLKEKDKTKYIHINNRTASSSLSSNYVWSINSNNTDTLYAGTIGGGLNILTFNKNNTYQVDYLTRANGLPDNDIESVLLDKHNRIWMGGRGISVYNQKAKTITNYDVTDGLQSNSFKIGASYYDAETEIMYFGGVNGINFFDPNLITPSKTPSDIEITGIEIFNSPIKIGKTINDRVLLYSRITDSTSISLKSKENEFSITYTPLNFIAPKRNKIKYKLEPYQKEWIVRNYPDFKTTYSNLPAGEYLFKVSTINTEDEVPSKIAQLKIKIEPHWYMTNLAIIMYFIGAIGLITLYHRFTSNRQKIKEQLINAEKEQLLNQGKLDFFTKISHEIRTPLTLIAGPLEDLINNRETTRNKEDVLNSMSRHVNRLLNMVNKLLDFRKMELGHDVLEASPTKINEFISEIFIFFKGKAFSKIINYEFIKLPEEITVYIDTEKIETILINLLSNAFKFTPNNGNISLKLEIKGDKNKNAVFNNFKEPIENYLEISVVDTGGGIPFAKKDEIFNQYYQLEKNSSFETIGNGIGLALVKSICNLHHLKIDVDSNAKKGSVFLLRIPLGKEYLGSDEIKDFSIQKKINSPVVLHQTLIDETEQNGFINKTITSGKKILIVEDNVEIRQFLNQHLEHYFKVFNAENGSIGFEIAKKEKPHIIISDVMMPVMNGMEFCKLIKTDDNLHHIPIILLTALTSTSNELEGLKLGIEDYIRKPFKIEILLAKISTILENRKFILEYYSKQLHFIPESYDKLSDDEIFLQEIIKLIEDNLTNEKLNVTFISRQMAMGRTKLYVKIKETTGRSIVEFVRDIRLKKAKSLLINTTETIEQISLQVGINNLKYFRRHFKEMYKLTPSKFRMRNSTSSEK